MSNCTADVCYSVARLGCNGMWHTASRSHILWHIVWGVKDSVHGVDFGKLQHAAIAQLAVGIKLPSPQAGFKDAEGRDLHKVQVLGHM